MTNTKAPDSAEVPATTAEKPILPVVQQSTGQPSSSGGIDANALKKEIAEEVAEKLRREIRAAQSEKDRTLKSYREDKAKIDEIYSYFKKYPDDPDRARREFEVDQLLQERSERASSSRIPGKDEDVGLEVRARRKLAKMGIDSEVEQTDIMKEWAEKNVPDGGYANDDAALVGMAEFVVDYRVAKAKRDAPASPASAIPPKGGVQAPRDVGVITAELAELQRGNLNDPANQAARTALLAELRKARSNQ